MITYYNNDNDELLAGDAFYDFPRSGDLAKQDKLIEYIICAVYTNILENKLQL